MKKFFTLFLLLVLSLTALAQQKKVAVYVVGDDAGISKVIGSKLVSAIARSEEYVAIERTAAFLAELSKEQNYQRTGAVDDSELSRLGKQFGVQYICVASIADAFEEKYISARLIDVESAQVERTASSSGAIQSLDDILVAANSVSQDLLNTLDKEYNSNSKKVAVYVVNNDAGKEIGRVLGDKLVAGFTNSGRYIAIERTSSFLSQLSKEQNYQRTGVVDDNDISRLGKQFGVQYVCVADVSDVFGEKFISARLIDVETAEVVNTHDVGGAMSNMNGCLEMASEIADGLSQVTIAELAKERTRIEQEGYVDLGLPSGTCWKKTNEAVQMTYNEAIKTCEKYLPNEEQGAELTENCEWVLVKDGVRVIGPNGNYFTLKETKIYGVIVISDEEDKDDKDDAVSFHATYLLLPSFPKYDYMEDKWHKCLHGLSIEATPRDPSYRGHVVTFGDIEYYEKNTRSKFGIILCQQVDALAKRQHDNRTLTTKKEYTTLYTKIGEFYCDGSYNGRDGQTFKTPYLHALNKDYFRVTFSFKALSYDGINQDPEQYPIFLSDYHRSMGLCLRNDGRIYIKTNNGKHVYETSLKYIPNQYCDIDIEYYKGWLTINGQKIWVVTNIDDNFDKQFFSIDYSSGNSFKGYLRDVKIYNVTNIEE